MFGFFRKRPAPALHPRNRNEGSQITCHLASEGRNWTEHVDVVRIAAATLKREGHATRNEKSWLFHAESGISLTPRFVDLQLNEDGSVQTATTIQCNHALMPPHGVFEFQHSTGSSIEESVSKGIEGWARLDLVTLLDAVRLKPRECMVMELTLPTRDGHPERRRRAVLGPIAQFTKSPPAETTGGADEHPFCPCCLLTNSFDAFRELFEGSGFFGVRLFAAREPGVGGQADCRVNGEDWEKGAEALRAYADTWPDAGYEFRKQYVVLQDIPT